MTLTPAAAVSQGNGQRGSLRWPWSPRRFQPGVRPPDFGHPAPGWQAADCTGGHSRRRGSVVGPAAALKVYFVEPRDFRDLVQRLTGARTAAGPAPAPPMGAGQRMTLTPAAAVSQGNGQAAGDFDYSPWFSAPMFSPAYAPAGFHGHHHGGNQGR
ncbi:hypothetical protein PR202_gb11429 [Eleusine coracana subsp. coracana]|uniref:VQ domain-containing protein n=1 Tax=Eleusine coracana subsp. coracana TaxID=191504 RepID=A0AAV5EMJ5_ELECO|nr:hypothetical protein PR202_gb11429 [Eleusine coracana subsp. coracana]